MNLRLAVYEWIDRFGLDEARAAALLRVAGFEEEPPALARRFWPAVAIAAAALAGFGVILWLAANWDDMGRMGRFALLEAAVLGSAAGAVLRPAWRAPLALLAMLCIGGLFAYFGQTYQTGADAWQLFALWAVLALPIALGARSDAVWTPWAIVAVTAIAGWLYAHAGHRFGWQADAPGTYFAAWLACVALVAMFAGAAGRWLGAGAWTLRTAGALAVVLVTFTGLLALFDRHIAPHYWVALLLFAAVALVLAKGIAFDVFLLSAVALGLDTLLVAGVARWMFFDRTDALRDPIGQLFLIGLLAAGLLAVSVSWVLRLAREHRGSDGHV
ncbi:MAG TPA: DUF2157 domain-containing protein [Ramlibacter sp.]|uniref:DUF2157 domain-containing protein n=1 Tax=Ramlibacter sp. TaxID=1917967 RepID=UPI002CA3E03C|nr:DUF2157 domain-containing protein [Ramlibacter sp.]HVZ44320.1 DUF2157 domain-containing protein [Ramlibacter sp.]